MTLRETVTRMTRRPLCDFFVASCQSKGGTYRLRLYEDGEAEVLQRIPMPSPMYLQLEKNKLWAVLRAPFSDCAQSGVAAYDATTGEQITDIFSTKGEIACHIAVEGDDVYCANYISGSVIKLPDRLALHEGGSVDPVRQNAPHAHAVCFSPDRRFVLCCDLGLDTVFVYDRELKPLSTAKAPSGAGARHLVFSKDGSLVYVMNEMGGSISVFSYHQGALTYVNTLPVLPPDFGGTGSGAAIKLSQSGERLYVTERATQSIITLSVEGANLKILARTDCKGKEPRDFTLLADDRFAVCCNQHEDTVALFQISPEGIPTFLNQIRIPAPLCAVEIDGISH